MKVYLIRHAEAVDKKQDPRRPLTTEGVKAARQLGRFLQKLEVRPSAIWHSPKRRSAQTARILSALLHPSRGLVQRKDIKPMSRPGGAAWDLQKAPHDVMIVGHLPHLGRLAAKLMKWKQARDAMEFAKPGVVVLERLQGSGWKLCCLVGPECIRPILKQRQ